MQDLHYLSETELKSRLFAFRGMAANASVTLKNLHDIASYERTQAHLKTLNDAIQQIEDELFERKVLL